VKSKLSVIFNELSTYDCRRRDLLDYKLSLIFEETGINRLQLDFNSKV